MRYLYNNEASKAPTAMKLIIVIITITITIMITIPITIHALLP